MRVGMSGACSTSMLHEKRRLLHAAKTPVLV